MSIADQIQIIARREYVLLRTCAKAVDQRLEPAVSKSPGLTSALDRVREVLHNFDGLVSRTSEQPTADRPDSSAPDASVAEPEVAEPEVAEPEVEQPEVEQPEVEPAESETAEREVAEPEVEQPVVESDEVEHLAEELHEQEDDHHAGELADNEDLRDVQARLRAKHALQEFNEQQL